MYWCPVCCAVLIGKLEAPSFVPREQSMGSVRGRHTYTSRIQSASNLMGLLVERREIVLKCGVCIPPFPLACIFCDVLVPPFCCRLPLFALRQENMSGQGQFHVLHQHFMEVGPASKALLLSTYAKLANLYPECRELVTPVRLCYILQTRGRRSCCTLCCSLPYMTDQNERYAAMTADGVSPVVPALLCCAGSARFFDATHFSCRFQLAVACC